MQLDWIHLHLIVNHFPVVLSVVGAAAALLAVIVRRDNVWRYAALTLILAGLAAPVALLSGRQAEDEAEETLFVTERSIHEHEERAEIALWLSLAAAVLAAVTFWRPRPVWRFSMALMALIAAGAMGSTAYEGGKIVHDSPQLERAVASYPLLPNGRSAG
jgi:uncharacterized membrane protein